MICFRKRGSCWGSKGVEGDIKGSKGVTCMHNVLCTSFSSSFLKGQIFIVNSYTEMSQMINYSSLLNTRIPIFDIEYLFWVLGKHYHYRSLISLSMNYLHAIYIFIHQDFYYPGFFSLHNITLGASMFWQPLPKSPHSIYLYC